MYTWQIDIWLKSGEKIKARYKGDETSSTEVVKRLLEGKPDNSWMGLIGETDSHNLIVKIGEIVAIDIYYLA